MESEITILSIIKDNFSAVAAILGALVSGLFTWLVTRYQFKIKKYEMESNVEFEARKLLFTSFKDNLDKYSQISEVTAKTFGEIYWSFALEGFDKKLPEVKTVCESVKKLITTYSSPRKELNRELLEINASPELLEKLNKVESIYQDLKNPKREVIDYEKEFFLLSDYYNLLNEIEAEAIELKSDKLFEKYIK